MRSIFFFIFLPIASSAHAVEFGNYYGAEYVRNYDGDTATFNLPDLHPLIANKISIRINGIDTPEIRGKCQQEKELAKTAQGFVEGLLSVSDNIDLINMQRGKYFRIVADVVVDGEMVKDALIENGLAVAYNGGTKVKNWCQ